MIFAFCGAKVVILAQIIRILSLKKHIILLTLPKFLPIVTFCKKNADYCDDLVVLW